MNTPTHILVAIGELGVREATGENDGVPATRYMDGDRLPWCAAFVLFCLNQAGYKPPINRWLSRNVNFFESSMKDLGYWMGPAVIPEAGDLFFMAGRDGSDSGPGRHMGLVERVDLLGGKLHTIEGNYENRVARVVRTLQRADLRRPRSITGYARPDWRLR